MVTEENEQANQVQRSAALEMDFTKNPNNYVKCGQLKKSIAYH